MKFKLKKSLFDLLINVPEVEQYIVNKVDDDDCINFNIDTKDIREVQLLINDEIVLNGMDNQDIVNSLGLKLYKLYDEILYQKDNQ
ncbi:MULTISPECIES: hypothetical protein [Clostridium]|uniref:hypothetical protein n=1 Tax=Clostridium TaxID=1485 RepID=UPI0025B85195|nr:MULTISPECIES: hypothetical protein [Clostridium]MDY4605408.1 hypothetical protein [Clostridium tertium]